MNIALNFGVFWSACTGSYGQEQLKPYDIVHSVIITKAVTFWCTGAFWLDAMNDASSDHVDA